MNSALLRCCADHIECMSVCAVTLDNGWGNLGGITMSMYACTSAEVMCCHTASIGNTTNPWDRDSCYALRDGGVPYYGSLTSYGDTE